MVVAAVNNAIRQEANHSAQCRVDHQLGVDVIVFTVVERRHGGNPPGNSPVVMGSVRGWPAIHDGELHLSPGMAVAENSI